MIEAYNSFHSSFSLLLSNLNRKICIRLFITYYDLINGQAVSSKNELFSVRTKRFKDLNLMSLNCSYFRKTWMFSVMVLQKHFHWELHKVLIRTKPFAVEIVCCKIDVKSLIIQKLSKQNSVKKYEIFNESLLNILINLFKEKSHDRFKAEPT
jgi:hypothetical protein